MIRLLALFAVTLLFAAPVTAQDKITRIGIIGCDTSHAPAFAAAFNGEKADPELAGFKIVACFPAGSPDFPLSRDRIQKFTEQVRDKYGVKIVDSIEDLLKEVDVVMLLSVDGRIHWKQAQEVLKARKPVFIDKPLSASLADAIRIMELARETKTPWMSCSSLRWSKGIQDAKKSEKTGPIVGCLTYGTCTLAPDHPDLSFYGVHGLEMLYALMGPGCETIQRTTTKDTDVVTGVWKDGRIATYRGSRGDKSGFGGTVFGEKGAVSFTGDGSYGPHLRELVKFFRTGVSPISTEEMVEVMAVIDAADMSKNQNGAPVRLADTFKAARAKIGGNTQ